MLRIGITGGIGVGKSMICHVFEALGVPCYNADLRTKFLQDFDLLLIEETKALLGKQSYTESGKLDRGYVASVIFKDPDLLKAYNQIVHPRVYDDFERWCLENKSYPFVVKESALMFETGFYKQLDATILVTCALDIRIQRIMKRDPQRTKTEIESIIEKQMPEAEKLKLASYCLNNDGQTLLLPTVWSLYQNFSIGKK